MNVTTIRTAFFDAAVDPRSFRYGIPGWHTPEADAADGGQLLTWGPAGIHFTRNPATNARASCLHAHCILVVDDDAHVRALFRRTLQDAGYFVVAAGSGRRALAAVRQAAFDLIVLDLRMPDVDGFEFLKIVRADLPNLKVLVVSGFLTGPMLEAAKLCGASATLDKPCAPNSLLTAVRGVLRS